jgi:hypothetical protein
MKLPNTHINRKNDYFGHGNVDYFGERVFDALVLLKDWYDTENRLQDKSWMYQIDREETDASSSNVTSEGMSEVEVNQSHEKQ